jgi:hypothetical protein
MCTPYIFYFDIFNLYIFISEIHKIELFSISEIRYPIMGQNARVTNTYAGEGTPRFWSIGVSFLATQRLLPDSMEPDGLDHIVIRRFMYCNHLDTVQEIWLDNKTTISHEGLQSRFSEH